MKKVLVIAAGAAAGLYVAPVVINALKIERSEGFGLDDAVAALAIAGTILLVDKVL